VRRGVEAVAWAPPKMAMMALRAMNGSDDPHAAPMATQSSLEMRPAASSEGKSLRYSGVHRHGAGGVARQPPVPESKVWKTVARVVESQQFETIMGGIILFNTVIIIHESDLEAMCYPDFADNLNECPTHAGKSVAWLGTANVVLLVVYTVEAALRFYVEQRDYFNSYWNLMDLVLLFCGWAGELSTLLFEQDMGLNLALLRFLRVARILRALRIFVAFHELHLLLRSLFAAMKTLVWGTVMMFATLTISSILIVEIVHPINSQIKSDCDSCSSSYRSVMKSNLTLFQTIILADNWGEISLPIIHKDPRTAILLIPIAITLTLGLMNLILAVIVERASEARERDFEARMKMKQMEVKGHKKELERIFQDMDIGGDGQLGLDELINAYDNSAHLQNAMKLLDVEREELPSLFKFLDVDHSGAISYSEFAEQICSVRGRDLRSLVLLMKMSLTELREDFRRLAPDACRDADTRACEYRAAKANEELAEGGDPGVKLPASRSKPGVTFSDQLQGSGMTSQSIYEIMGEQSKLLSRHSCLLEAVDSRFEQLMQQITERLSGSNSLMVSEALAAASPAVELPPKQRSVQSLLEDVSSLGRHAKELAVVKGNIVRRVEGHVSTLIQQAGTLAEINTLLKAGLQISPRQLRHPGEPVPIATFSGPDLERLNDKLGRVRSNMREELATTLPEVEQQLENGASVLGRNTELLSSLLCDVTSNAPGSLSGGGLATIKVPPIGRYGPFDKHGDGGHPEGATGRSFWACETVHRPSKKDSPHWPPVSPPAH